LLKHPNSKPLALPVTTLEELNYDILANNHLECLHLLSSKDLIHFIELPGKNVDEENDERV